MITNDIWLIAGLGNPEAKFCGRGFDTPFRILRL